MSKRGLMKLAKKHPGTIKELMEWYKTARRADWTRLEDVRRNFASADQIGEVLVFDICHNDYRLVSTADYPTKRIFVKALLSHKEYDRKEWMRWAKL
ncbi:MAG TPA: type II toxin-antitoxin system HigB family toxin [Bryobacteraceae bacterium]|jgi:mRNA interferase HigB|nr:type II toxin-antitoxin system HigB family toxin [Bryobacteraceae bacterium]